MGTDRIKRVNELLRREIADLLYRVLHDEGVELSSVTLTHVVTSPDLRRARVMVSITGSKEQQHEILSTIKRHRKALQHKVGQDVKLKYTPRLSFELDASLAEGDHVLQIMKELEEAEQTSTEHHASSEQTPSS